jgi:deoxyribodipyrimidine photolyase-like uncharacterized protein
MQAFVAQRLPLFGRYQDAIWPDDPWLYHSHLSAALNLKLLNPRKIVAAAEAAYHDGLAGDRACPFTTSYWEFLLRHEALLIKNPRIALQVKNLARAGDADRQAVRARAAAIRRGEVAV